jgi:CheY-like chemotaxis protein
MSTSNGSILLVDDDPSILHALGDTLQSNGYNVIRSISAEHALGRLSKERPDLIILDINMPGMGGMSFLKTISGADGALRYPVLVFTARAVLADFFADLGVVGFLPKTAEPEALLEKVKRALAQREAALAERETATPRRLLLVEDDAAIRESLLRFFRQHGYDAWGVSDGFSIAAVTHGSRPDAILLKYILPHMNGPAIAQMLADEPLTRDVSIVLYDASGIHSTHDPHPHIKAFVPSADGEALLKALREAARNHAGEKH